MDHTSAAAHKLAASAEPKRALLCEYIICEAFGELVGDVARVLLQRGRITLHTLCRCLPMPSKIVRSALVTLIQHHCCFYATRADDPFPLYEINQENVMLRLWHDAIINQLADEQCFLVATLLQNGTMRGSDLVEALCSSSSWQASKTRATQALSGLCQRGYLGIMTANLTSSPQDEAHDYRERKLAEMPKNNTPKMQKALASEVYQFLLRRVGEDHDLAQEDAFLEPADEEEHVRKRRKADSDRHASKRPNILQTSFNPESYYMINYTRFLIKFRNKMVEDSTRARYNRGVALVMQQALKLTEAKQRRLREPLSERFRTTEILEELAVRRHGESRAEVMRSFVSMASEFNVLNPESCEIQEFRIDQKTTQELVGEILVRLAREDEDFLEAGSGGVAEHAWLERSGGPTVRKQSTNRDGETWRINFAAIRSSLKLALIENYIRHRLDAVCWRIWLLLLLKGNLEEKTICKQAMIPAKECRDGLLSLYRAQLIESQEVPRTNERIPQRTVFLWFVNLNRVETQLVSQAYDMLVNINIKLQGLLCDNGILVAKGKLKSVQEDPSLLKDSEHELIRTVEYAVAALRANSQRLVHDIFILSGI